MDETEIARLEQALRARSVEVDIDVHPYHSGASLPALVEQDALRTASLARGERVAYEYTNEFTRQNNGWRLWIRASLVDAAAVQRLLTAGARWVGPPHLSPNP